jgi:hypothetical protein
MEERREYERKEMYFKVVLSAPEQPYRRITAEAIDLSMGGMRPKLKEAIRSKGKVAVRITRPFYQDNIEGSKGFVGTSSRPFFGKGGASCLNDEVLILLICYPSLWYLSVGLFNSHNSL